MSGEPAGNGHRTNSHTILFAVSALLGSSGWAYAGLAGDDTKEVRTTINRHEGDLRLLRYQMDALLTERDRERDRED